ncbi:hypothetical protein [uncultured Maribacter sp.]|uniref:hypothetical protein n=1 Tax=uncultured Maribacter sp. TaxID=431308 RepID=UPI0030EBE471|tara:strand:- start:63650 stop:64279 length:630 start_codon:yes stop_codon:yes gene_type:complete
MINLIVSYDDNDVLLGDYFNLSYQDITTYFSAISDVTIFPIRGLDCTEVNVINLIGSLNHDKFGFIGLSHGNESQLLTDNESFVDIENVAHFKKSLFYTPACDTGIKLGDKIVDDGCYAFIGCINETCVTFEEFNHIYIECENYCIKEFLGTDITIKEAFQNMLNFFDDKIIELLDQNDDEILVAMELIGNKDSFVLLGNENLVKQDLK